MSKTGAEAVSDTRTHIVEAARKRLLDDGHSRLSTRKVAETAGVPLSQLHYHFGSKQGLLLAVLDEENRRRLARQTRMYAADFLEDDLDSGYVRVLQEMIAEGWTNPAVAGAVRDLLGGWYDLLKQVAEEAEVQYGRLGPFTAAEVATLIGTAFIGSEALILLGFDRDVLPVRAALRRIGVVIRRLEEHGSTREGDGASTTT